MTDSDILCYDILLASMYMAVDDGVMSCYVIILKSKIMTDDEGNVCYIIEEEVPDS